ncbi:13618_t:CDS:2 [Acaulospora colombiana]|uniref:13618_t:CDS:1 n=1 Tax=Acaulospora colombiana TaxID=27376 RepID=A0ACA9KSP0_9GLOM|nr:13618_t:CDS:2 [Acaulospora colombiana]
MIINYKKEEIGVNVSLEVNINNDHSILKLHDPQFLTGSKVEDLLSDIDPLNNDNG